MQQFGKLEVNLNGLVVKVLDYQSRSSVFKTIGIHSAFHPSEVDKMSGRKFCELCVIKQTASSKWR